MAAPNYSQRISSMTARIAPDNQAEGISKQERAACVTKSRAGIGGSACAASIREGVRLPLVACRCRRCAALTARSGRRAGVLSRPTWVRQRVTVSPADLLSSRIVTLILGELAEYGDVAGRAATLDAREMRASSPTGLRHGQSTYLEAWGKREMSACDLTT